MMNLLILALAALPAYAADLPPVLPGWDSCKWNDPAHQTPKYVVGRLFAALPPSPSSLAAVAAGVDKLYPGTSLVDSSGMDKINIPCVGLIDTVVNSGGKENPDGGDSWAWQVVEDKCGACRPNKCEEVSKSKKCGAAAAAPKNSNKGLPTQRPERAKKQAAGNNGSAVNPGQP